MTAADRTLELITRLRHAGVSTALLLLRHSIRYRDLTRPDVTDLLTPEGRQCARELGGKLPRARYRFVTSPVERCIETARELAAGLEASGAPVEHLSDRMAELGPYYVHDHEAVRRGIAERGLQAFLEAWVSAQSDLGLMDGASAWRRLCAALLERLGTQPPGCLDICVTHDWNLLLAKRFALATGDWAQVDFLEGLALWQSAEGDGTRTFCQATNMMAPVRLVDSKGAGPGLSSG